jgi:hypothetical protein
MKKISFIRLSLVVSCIVFSISLAQAQTSVFTYQGKLTDTNAAANGQYDFTFKLFDSGGTQIGADAVRDDVQVSGGIFTVNLDFGASAFSSSGTRFLEISVRTGASTGAFTPLSPRQEITSAPFAIQTLKATSADLLSNSCVLCVTDAQIQSINGSKVTGTVANATNAINAATATTAGNVTGIVQVANGGTGSSTKNFVDLSTNQTNIGGDKTFTGVLSGNGAGLTNVPGTLKWQTVTGLAQQAQPNNGYLTTNDGRVTITLPTAPNIGDIVRVSSVGAGGWQIAQNSGQSVLTAYLDLNGKIWIPRDSNRAWQSIAYSADGSTLVAVVDGGQIYTSFNSGANWSPNFTNKPWRSVASSSNGTKMVAVVSNGQIYTSTDSGFSWTPHEINRLWFWVASSADGTKLVAVDGNGRIYTSSDSGVSWIPHESNRFWQSVASSSDGTKLVAVVFGGQIYTSTDSGVTWIPHEINRQWQSVASSSDGTKLVAVVYGGQIYTSTDSGASWTPRESNRAWTSVASSADGTKLVAAAQSGRIYVSIDSGLFWTPYDSNRNWLSVASSADGSKLVAVENGGQIYTFDRSSLSATTTLGANGYLLGGQFTSIELQYIGNGQFLPISFTGPVFAY